MEKISAETPFLDKNEQHEDGSIDDDISPRSRPNPLSWVRNNMRSILVHVVLMFSYTILAGAVIHLYAKPRPENNLVYSPANTALRYESLKIKDSPADVGRSLFVGKPSPEKDAEWYRLLHYHNIRVTEDELKAMNTTSVSLGTGGYQGMMAVMHELHCLKLVREALHPEYYWKEKSEKEISIMKGHNEHCIDALRMATMCRADTAIFPFHWKDGMRTPAPTWSQNHHCVNWDTLVQWMDSRVVDIKKPGMLVHPKLGPSYPNS